MATLVELWRRRERPPLLSRRWFIVWLKRGLSLPALLMLQWRVARLRLRGANIGRMVVLQKCRIQGPARNLRIGDGAFIGTDCQITLHDRIDIGAQAVVNQRVTILTASHSLRDPAWSQYSKPVCIAERAWIATGAMLLPGVTIGRGAVVGAGSVVRSGVPEHALAVGNPAQVRSNARTAVLTYDTASFPAPFEAWIGRQAQLNA